MTMSKSFRQVVLPIIVAMIWGSAFLVQGSVADKMGAFTFNGLRSIVAVITLGSFVVFRFLFRKDKKAPAIKSDKKTLVISGVLCGIALCVASNLQQFGMFGTTLEGGNALTEGDSAFITALYIILVPIFSALIMKRSPSWNVWISAVVALIGLFFICNVTAKPLTVYHAELFLCSLVFTAHIIIIDYFGKNVDGIELSLVQFAVMGASSLICAVIFDKIEPSVIIDCLPQLLYAGVFSCSVAYTLQIVAQKGTNPTVVSILLSMESLFALLFEILVGIIVGNVKEHGAMQIVGCVLMVLAIIFAQLNFNKNKNVLTVDN